MECFSGIQCSAKMEVETVISLELRTPHEELKRLKRKGFLVRWIYEVILRCKMWYTYLYYPPSFQYPMQFL